MNVVFDNYRFSTDLQQRRYRDRLSMDKVAKRTGISKATLSRIEKGNQVDLFTYIIICRFLNKPFNHYFTIEE